MKKEVILYAWPAVAVVTRSHAVSVQLVMKAIENLALSINSLL